MVAVGDPSVPNGGSSQGSYASGADAPVDGRQNVLIRTEAVDLIRLHFCRTICIHEAGWQPSGQSAEHQIGSGDLIDPTDRVK